MKLLIPSLACSLCVVLLPSSNLTRFGFPSKTKHFHAAVSLFSNCKPGNCAQHSHFEYLNQLLLRHGSYDACFLCVGQDFRMDYQPDTSAGSWISLNEVTYGTLINGLCKTGHTSAAIQVLRRIPRHGIVPNVFMYNSIIDSLCKDTLYLIDGYARKERSKMQKCVGCDDKTWVDEALNLFEEMRRKYLVPNTVTYNTLIDGLSKSKRISCALELLVKMHERGPPADVVTYNSLLDGMFNIKQVDEALMLFKQMKESGIDPDIFTYNVLIDGLCKDENDMAEKLLREMVARGLLNDKRSVTTCFHLYLKLLSFVWVISSDILHAEWMVPEVLRNEPSNETLGWNESMQVVGAVGFQHRALSFQMIWTCYHGYYQAMLADRSKVENEIMAALKQLHKLIIGSQSEVSKPDKEMMGRRVV
ncbi:Pentatricopeptide repeat-containing protein [Arachis hypogaea]|nr:Pentatricopeptide repeat-containing protein [Arachis hypogaea]